MRIILEEAEASIFASIVGTRVHDHFAETSCRWGERGRERGISFSESEQLSSRTSVIGEFSENFFFALGFGDVTDEQAKVWHRDIHLQ